MDNMTGMPEQGPGSAVAREAVSTPAILLIVAGALNAVGALVGLVQVAMGMGGIPPELLNDPDVAQFQPWFERLSAFGTASNAVALGLGVVTIFGGIKMKNLESHGLAMAAAIIALIPCLNPCCCVGIPVGIWSLIVLNKPEVKAAFH